MPELPEVETIVRALRKGGRGDVSIVQRRIHSVDLRWARTLASPKIEDFSKRIIGHQITDVTRRGKFIIIHLDEGFILVHLRMSGDLRVTAPPIPAPAPHDRLIITFEDGHGLIFNDPRKFGRVWLTNDPSEVTGNLGPEPFDLTFTPGIFYQNLHRRKKYIKSLLLDQSFVAGLGNIYVDESLFKAGIFPLRLSNTLSIQEANKLLEAIRETLKDGINNNGASIDWVYRGGDYQNKFRVYQQTGKPCQICGSPIERIVAGQRGTHYCPKCQPKGVDK
ncbi:formamidopyrimidine-DNA glycosylase [Leptolinea sp. HRD-7]|nr:formamidopyrimidine-DNA glycosylase [Leptolinea sp. HRD-7]